MKVNKEISGIVRKLHNSGIGRKNRRKWIKQNYNFFGKLLGFPEHFEKMVNKLDKLKKEERSSKKYFEIRRALFKYKIFEDFHYN